ncbi:unnamed protein product [Heterobilharzia americana]|nr:unnamed protein product [Heterobilharzia americana]
MSYHLRRKWNTYETSQLVKKFRSKEHLKYQSHSVGYSGKDFMLNYQTIKRFLNFTNQITFQKYLDQNTSRYSSGRYHLEFLELWKCSTFSKTTYKSINVDKSYKWFIPVYIIKPTTISFIYWIPCTLNFGDNDKHLYHQCTLKNQEQYFKILDSMIINDEDLNSDCLPSILVKIIDMEYCSIKYFSNR